MENVINDLVGYDKLKIVQNNDYFNFSLDSVLLPNFATINLNTKKIMDLGCGNAPIPLILSTRTKEKIIGVEIQKEIFELAKKTVKINNLQNQIELYNMDIKELTSVFPTDTFDLILSNPPYFKYDRTSIINEIEIKTIARHEVLITLEDIIKVSKVLLKNKASLCLIHRTDRLIEIINLMQKYNIEPKKIRFIYPKKNKESNLVLIEGIKNGRKGLKLMSPLIVHKNDGTYTKEILEMFGR